MGGRLFSIVLLVLMMVSLGVAADESAIVFPQDLFTKAHAYGSAFVPCPQKGDSFEEHIRSLVVFRHDFSSKELSEMAQQCKDSEVFLVPGARMDSATRECVDTLVALAKDNLRREISVSETMFITECVLREFNEVTSSERDEYFLKMVDAKQDWIDSVTEISIEDSGVIRASGPLLLEGNVTENVSVSGVPVHALVSDDQSVLMKEQEPVVASARVCPVHLWLASLLGMCT